MEGESDIRANVCLFRESRKFEYLRQPFVC